MLIIVKILEEDSYEDEVDNKGGEAMMKNPPRRFLPVILMKPIMITDHQKPDKKCKF